MPRVVGTLLRETDNADAFAAGGSGGAGNWTLIRKTADESRVATTLLVADSDLTVALPVGMHVLHGVAYMNTANATMDYRFDLTFTGTATWEIAGRRFMAAGALGSTDQENNVFQSSIIGPTTVTATTTGIGRVEFEVVLNVSAAGSFQFRWAQNTSDAGALTCKAGSRLEYLTL